MEFLDLELKKYVDFDISRNSYIDAEKNVIIEKPSSFPYNPKEFINLFIGRNSYYQFGIISPNVIIGRYCSISHYVHIGASVHPIHHLTTGLVHLENTNVKLQEKYTIIGSDVWIGLNVVIMSGVNIGHGAVIGAGAVVTKDVPPYAIVGGVPAKVIKYRFSDDVIEELLLSKWWEFDPIEIEYLPREDIEACMKYFREKRIVKAEMKGDSDQMVDNVMDEKGRIKEIFDNWYYKGFSTTTERGVLGEYTQTGLFNDFLKWRVFLNVLSELKPNLSEYKVFDAGCGNGNAIRKLIEYGVQPKNCYGVDISSDAIDYAQKYSPASVKLQQGYIDRTDFAPDSFDLIFSLGVLIHILDDNYIRALSAEFRRIVKRDGLVIVTVSDADLDPGWGALSHTTRNFSYSGKELEGLFSGFDCVGIYRTYNDFYPAEINQSQILAYIEKNMLDTAFKTYVFRPK